MGHDRPHVVMLVDDDADIRETVSELLQQTGREVVTAREGAEALKKLSSGPRPCLILLDLMMPGVDGFEVLRRLRHDSWPQDLCVLVISAHATVPLAQTYPGVLGTLKKPFHAEELLSWVELVEARC